MISVRQSSRSIGTFLLFLLRLQVQLQYFCYASTPNTIVTIKGNDDKVHQWLAKRATFGSKEALTGLLVGTPLYDPFLCEYFREGRNYTVTPTGPSNGEKWIMMVPRGLCTFERKAFAAKMWYGASGVLVYDSLSARYQWNTVEDKMYRWPQKELDYECSKGFGIVSDIALDPPAYNGPNLDPILDMTSSTSRCTLEKTGDPCESQLCLVTGPPGLTSSDYPVCCAWDLPITMGGDNKESPGNTDDILAVFLTIRQGADVFEFIGEMVTVEPRPYRAFNISQVFLWILGVVITFLAAYMAASDLRIFRAKLERYEETKAKKDAGVPLGNAERTQSTDVATPNRSTSIETAELQDSHDSARDLDGRHFASTDDEEAPLEGLVRDEPTPPKPRKKTHKPKKKKEKEAWSLHSLPPKGKEDDRGTVFTLYSLPPPQRKPKEKRQRQRPGYKAEVIMETDVLPSDGEGRKVPTAWTASVGGFEMTQWHVFGFIAIASFMLFMLFYFRFYPVIFVLYGFGCAGAVSYVIFGPILVRMGARLQPTLVEELNKNVVCGRNAFDVTSQLLGFIWAIVWIWYGMSHYRPSTNAFFWITINVFGACFCILSLSMMKLGNIKIATMLLLAVFIYDIFFVFITPLFLDGQSIMITVARGGAGESTADDFCFKYPEHKDCTGIDFLPMLLILPRVNDYQQGSALLGLGDIVLPGYLIAFGARLDEAKRLVGKHGDEEMAYTDKWYQGYFFWLMVAYAIGLGMAFAAFAISETGQPALLYLVPCCLGMICIIGRKELKDLWTGSRAIQLALTLQNQFERAWGKEKMRRDAAKAKRRRQDGEGHHPYRPQETESTRDRGGAHESPGRGSSGRRGPGRGGPGRESSDRGGTPGRGRTPDDGPGPGLGRRGARSPVRPSMSPTRGEALKSSSSPNSSGRSPSPGRRSAKPDGNHPKSPRSSPKKSKKSRGLPQTPDLFADKKA